MPWKCFMVTMEEQNPPRPDPDQPGVKFGTLWRTPEGDLVPFNKLKVGAMYFNKNGLFVKLPGYHGCNAWGIDQPGTNDCRWTRTGEPPEITVVPSVNCNSDKIYHGFVTAGFVTDDISGKRFTDTGVQL